MGKPKPLSLNEWMHLTGTTNRELSRMTEAVDPEGKRRRQPGEPEPKIGVSESTIREVRKGENTTLRIARLLVEASKTKPAMVDGARCHVWWEALYDL